MRGDYVFKKLINIIIGSIGQVQCQINGGVERTGRKDTGRVRQAVMEGTRRPRMESIRPPVEEPQSAWTVSCTVGS